MLCGCPDCGKDPPPAQPPAPLGVQREDGLEEHPSEGPSFPREGGSGLAEPERSKTQVLLPGWGLGRSDRDLSGAVEVLTSL